MTRFEPFHALRYHAADSSMVDISDLVAPPYDVVSDEQRQALQHRHLANSVRLDYPDGKRDPAAYAQARVDLDEWRAGGIVLADDTPTFTVYRMTDAESGHVTTGVFGGLGLEHPGVGDVLPHEETTAKDKADRLSLIRSTEINTSPIWILATAPGLGALCNRIADSRSANAVATDLDGVTHAVWVVSDPSEIDAIRSAVEAGPVVVADGHHRLETALTYETERSEANAILTLVVELSPDSLEVRPIHRIVSGVDTERIVDALGQYFALDPAGSSAADGPTLVLGDGTSQVLVPKADLFGDEVNLDSQRVRIALKSLSESAGLSTAFHHDAETVRAAARNDKTVGILLRPATVDQIRVVADERRRMPPKTTFFYPKPRTGMLFRPVVR